MRRALSAAATRPDLVQDFMMRRAWTAKELLLSQEDVSVDVVVSQPHRICNPCVWQAFCSGKDASLECTQYLALQIRVWTLLRTSAKIQALWPAAGKSPTHAKAADARVPERSKG